MSAPKYGRRWIFVVALLAALPSQGCDDLRDFFYELVGEEVPSTLDGQLLPLKSVVPRVATGIPGGTVELSGSYGGDYLPLAAEPATAAAAAVTLPSTLRFVVERKSPSGLVIETRNFDVAVQATGNIAPQSFPLPSVVLGPGDEVAASLRPMGADLPAGKLTLRLRYRRT